MFALRGLAQREGGRDGLGLAAPRHALLDPPVLVCPLVEPRGPLPRLLEPPLEPVHLLHAGQVALRLGAGRVGGGQREVRDGEPLAGGGAGYGGPRENGVGEPGVAGRGVGGGQFDDVPRGLLHAVCVGEQLGVRRAHFALGGATLLGESLLGGGEAPCVEEPAEELAAGLGVGPQEPCEVPCGSRTTWQNCSLLIPRSWLISSPISWWERLRSFQVPAVASYSRSQLWALSMVVPVPRFLGRSHGAAGSAPGGAPRR